MPERRWRSEKRGELVGVVGMPARQRRAVADDVLRAPQDAAIVDVGGDVVVRADNVKIALPHPLDQHIDYLVRGPRAGRLLGPAARGHASEGRARDQQVRSDLATLDVAQRMREALGQHLHPGLRDVVGGVAWRAGNPLLGAGVYDRARRLLVDHRLGEGVDAVDDAPEIDPEHALPALVMVEW